MQLDAYTPLVHRIAARIHARTDPSEFELADLVQLGMVGLLEAASRYTPARGTAFETFAAYRINGAILNGLHGYSERQRQLEVQRELTDDQAAEKPQKSMVLGPDDSATLGIGWFEAEAPATDDAYIRIESEQLRQQVANLTKCLPESERRVIAGHYFQQMPFEQVAREMGLTKGRISQLHHAGLRRLRERLANVSATLLL